MKLSHKILSVLFFFNFGLFAAEPVRLHPDNPKYFLFRGKPTVFITSAEHYGAVVNADFDFVTYLDALQACRFNYTRIITGAYLENGGFGLLKNTLDPARGKTLVPWARSNDTGYVDGGNKFDLKKWDEGFFTRLKSFVAEAGKRGIVVEVTLFSSYYTEEQWKNSPFHPSNNINKISQMPKERLQTLYNGDLWDHQEAYIRKIVSELAGFDNVIYEIQNEPWSDHQNTASFLQVNDTVVKPNWLNRVDLADVTALEFQKKVAWAIRDQELKMKTRHLIAQNICSHRYAIPYDKPEIDIFNFHYALPEAALENWELQKPICFDESGFTAQTNYSYRKQAWRFMLAGGASFNNLDYSFTVGKESGTDSVPANPGWGGRRFRNELSQLVAFFNTSDFIHMKPDIGFINPTTIPETSDIQAMINEGKEYIIYLGMKQKFQLKMGLPAGRYNYQFIIPATGKVIQKLVFDHKGGEWPAPPAPDYKEDAFVKITREVMVKPK